MEKDTKQLRSQEEVLGKTISGLYLDDEIQIFIFSDDTWAAFDFYGESFLEDDYFAEGSPRTVEKNWLNRYVLFDSEFSGLILSDLGNEFIRLGYFTKEDVEKHWVLEKKSQLEARLLVLKAEYSRWSEKNPKKALDKANDVLSSFLKKYKKYLGDEESNL
jgi:hypothetical protein